MIARFLASGIVATIALSTFAAATRIHDLGDFSGKKSRKGGTNQSLRHRELKSKSSKGTQPVCLSFGEVAEIKGTDVVQTGPVDAGSDCDATNEATWDSDTCVHYAEPFFINAQVGSTTTFVFDDGTDSTTGYSFTDPPLGDGALCGSVNSDANDKVTLTYFGDLTDPSDPAGYDLQNEPAEHLESAKYSFWVESCPSGGSSPCANEFYLNVYTRRNNTSTNYYDCRFDYVPSQGGAKDSWTTFDLPDIRNAPATANSFSGGLFIPPDCHGGKSTLQEYIDAEAALGNEVVLGTTFFEVLKFNIGDTAPKNGLSGCYDALHIKLSDEEATRVYDFE